MNSFFYGRKHELEQAKSLIEAEKQGMILIHGRSGVGKTAFLRELIRIMPEKSFRIYSVPRGGSGIAELESVFGSVSDDRVLLIDNAQNAAVEDWLTLLSKPVRAKMILVLSGDFSEDDVEELSGFRSALKSRILAKFALSDFSWWNMKPILRAAQIEDPDGDIALAAYAMSGGNPRVLAILLRGYQQDGRFPVSAEELIRLPYHSMEAFAMETAPYYRIMKAIADGEDRLSSIASALGMSVTSVPKYLNVLTAQSMIERENTVVEKYKQNSRNGRYRIRDVWTRFWFRAIYANMGEVECTEDGEMPECVRNILYTKQIPEMYQEICRSSLWSTTDKVFDYDRVGKWWNRSNLEIPIVAVRTDGEDILFGTVNADKNRQFDLDDWKKLLSSAEKVDWCGKNGDRRQHFILFSEGGFTDRMIKFAEKEKDIRLVNELPGKGGKR